MRKLILVISLFISLHSFSQETEVRKPIHYARIDVLKSAFCDLHCSYEWFNGRKVGIEIGLGAYYQSHALNKSLRGSFGTTCYLMKGVEFDFKRKFYFPSETVGYYLAPVLRYSYKYWKSLRSFDDTGDLQSTGLMLEFGIGTKVKNGFSLQGFFGFGFAFRTYHVENYRSYGDPGWVGSPGGRLLVGAGLSVGWGFGRK